MVDLLTYFISLCGSFFNFLNGCVIVDGVTLLGFFGGLFLLLVVIRSLLLRA